MSTIEESPCRHRSRLQADRSNRTVHATGEHAAKVIRPGSCGKPKPSLSGRRQTPVAEKRPFILASPLQRRRCRRTRKKVESQKAKVETKTSVLPNGFGKRDVAGL
jgi:hypothetical protein